MFWAWLVLLFAKDAVINIYYQNKYALGSVWWPMHATLKKFLFLAFFWKKKQKQCFKNKKNLLSF